MHKLSEREIEILKYSVLDRNTIAESLNIAVSTVLTHQHNAFTKLFAHSKAEAIIYALRLGLIKLEEIVTTLNMSELKESEDKDAR